MLNKNKRALHELVTLLIKEKGQDCKDLFWYNNNRSATISFTIRISTAD